MTRAFKKPITKQSRAAHYPAHRTESHPLVLKDEDQLCLLQVQHEIQTFPKDLPVVPNRYYQNGAAEKVLGAVYTPPRVAAALSRWAVRTASDKVLDPSCGEGVFLSAARTRLADLGARKPHKRCLELLETDTPRWVNAFCACEYLNRVELN